MAAAQRIGSTGLDRLKRERNRLNRLGITWGVQASKRQCLAEDNGRAQPVIWRSTWFYWRQNASGYLQSKRIKTDQCTQLQPTSFKSPCGCTPQAADPDWTDWAEWADQPRSATVDADSMCLWFSQSFADGSRWIRKKDVWKKATTVWQTPAIRSAVAQWEKLPHYAARMRDAFLSSQESENRHFIYNPTFRIKCSPHINAQYSKAAESRQPPNLMTTFQAWTEFEIQPTLAHTVGLGQLPWWMRWL